MNEEELENMLEQGNPSVFTQVCGEFFNIWKKKSPVTFFYVRGMTSTRLTNSEMQIINFDILYRQNKFYPILKFGYSEKATKFEKIFHLKFDSTQ